MAQHPVQRLLDRRTSRRPIRQQSHPRLRDDGDRATRPARCGRASPRAFESPCMPNYWPTPTSHATRDRRLLREHDFATTRARSRSSSPTTRHSPAPGDERVPVNCFASFSWPAWTWRSHERLPDPDGLAAVARQRVPPILGCGYRHRRTTATRGGTCNIVIFSSTGDRDEEPLRVQRRSVWSACPSWSRSLPSGRSRSRR